MAVCPVPDSSPSLVGTHHATHIHTHADAHTHTLPAANLSSSKRRERITQQSDPSIAQPRVFRSPLESCRRNPGHPQMPSSRPPGNHPQHSIPRCLPLPLVSASHINSMLPSFSRIKPTSPSPQISTVNCRLSSNIDHPIADHPRNPRESACRPLYRHPAFQPTGHRLPEVEEQLRDT